MTGKTLPRGDVTADVAAITSMAGKVLQGIGACPSGRITLMLAPGSEKLAARIRARFGPAVLTTIGLTVWNGRPGRSPRCGALPTTSQTPKDLILSLHLTSTKVRAGAQLGGSLAIAYRGPSTFEMDTGQPVETVVVLPHTSRVVGVYSGAIAGTGYGVRLSQGQSYSVTVVGGTARCDGGLGSALSPGRYQVVAVVMDETGKAPRYLTPPVNIRVVPR